MALYPIFLELLNMTAAGSIAILLVLAARLLLKKAPKWISYALWSVVLFRLLCPVTLESPVSLMPEATQKISEAVEFENYEMVSAGSAADAAYRAVGDTLNGGIDTVYVKLDIPEDIPKEEAEQIQAAQAFHDQVWPLLFTYLWPIGMGVMAIYSLVSLIRLKQRLIGAVPLEGNVWLADYIDSPFVLGLVRPKIYLPSSLSEEKMDYILLHERTHLRRFDHITRALAFLTLTIHWFNPLVWVAFLLSGRDMELSCDEAVLKQLGPEIKQDYSLSLLQLSTGKRIIAATPLAFGEGDAKRRIKNVMHYKKPSFWVIPIALTAAVALGVTLITNQTEDERSDTTFTDWFWSVAENLQNPEASEDLFQSIGTIFDQQQTVNGVTATLEGALQDGDYLLLSVSFNIPNTAADTFVSVPQGDSWIRPTDELLLKAYETAYQHYGETVVLSDKDLQTLQNHYTVLTPLTMRYQNRPNTQEYRLLIKTQYVNHGECVLHLENLELGSTTIAGPYDFTFTVEEKDISRTYTLDTDVEIGEGITVHVDEVIVSPFFVELRGTTENTHMEPGGTHIEKVLLSSGRYAIGGNSGWSSSDDGSTHLKVGWQNGPFSRIIAPETVTSIQLGDAVLELQKSDG